MFPIHKIYIQSAMAPLTTLALAVIPAISSLFTQSDIYSHINCSIAVSYANIATLPHIINYEAPAKNSTGPTFVTAITLSRVDATHITGTFKDVIAQIDPRFTVQTV